MTEKLTLNKRLIFTGIVTVFFWTQLIWDYFHEGVPTHHILHQKDLPGISNWWGGVVLPLLTWILLYYISKRENKNDKSTHKDNLTSILYRFLGAFFFGVLISIFFTLGIDDLPFYMMLGIMLVSFFTPLYLSEYLLGFVLGMTYTFGAILPIGVGALLSIIFIVAYKLVRFGVLYVISKIR